MTFVRQSSFSAGEISPDLYGRVDLDHYALGLDTLRNFFVNYHGGVSTRAGTQFIAEVKDSSKATRLIPFQFSTTQTYILEFGDQYMRVYKDAGQVLSGASAYEISTPYLEADLFRLKFTQSADVMTITHPTYAPRELSRTGHTSWTLSTIAFGPAISAPTGESGSGGGSGGYSYSYKITAVQDDVTGEESLPSSAVTLTGKQYDISSSANTIDLSWTAVSGARQYYVYKDFGKDGSLAGVYGYIGTAEDEQFTDSGALGGIEPDYSDTPPRDISVFGSSGEYPGCVTYYQQRLAFSGASDYPQRVNASKSGNYKNFGYALPQKSDDAIEFTIAANEVNEVRHLVSINGLLALTSGGEWLLAAGNDQVLTPSTVMAKRQSKHGCSHVPPIVIGDSALFLQRQGNKVRTLGYSLEKDGFSGSDLTIRSTHLLKNYTIVDWAYAEEPYSTIWVVRNDGVLLSLTYMPDQQVYGWARHDTDGEYESVAVIEEDGEDVPYFVVKRTVNGSTKRYVERLHSREFDEIRESFCVDSGLSYDGRNTDSGKTMTLTGGTDWDRDENLTLTLSGDTFPASPEGNVYVLRSGSDYVRLTVDSRDSSTVCTVSPDRTVPDSLQATATADWEYAVDEISGLDHLEGETVSILYDGNVHAQKTVASGGVTLQEHAAVIHIGLPYTCDFKTLPIAANQGSVLRPRYITVPGVSLLVKDSRGIFAGPDYDSLDEFKQRDAADGFEAIPTLTGLAEILIDTAWGTEGQFCVRQSDPLPLTILAAYPQVQAGGDSMG